jgi:hemoglobin
LVGLLLAGCGSSSPAPSRPPPPPAEEAAAAPAEEASRPPPVDEEAAEEAAAAPAASAPATLFTRLGGLPAITLVVEEFVARTTTDPRIMHRFFNTDAVTLKRLLVEFVCAATGGSCQYTGRDMPSSHAGMELVDEEFDALVEDLVGALDKFGVPEREKGELLGALGPLRPQMVMGPGKLSPIPEARLAKVSAVAARLSNVEAQALLSAAVMAGRRGQRSYAEQLFSRAEMAVGARKLAKVADVFRSGAPPRVASALKRYEASAPQPGDGVGSSEEDAPPRRPESGSLSGKLTVQGQELTGVGLVMLWPKGGGGGARRSPKTRVIEQRNKAFAPPLLAVPVGSTVAFPNLDAIYHNVFSVSKAQRFDLGMYKSGEMREMKFTKPGIVRVGCNIHANMSSYIVVVDAPHYVVAQQGEFSFRSLRPGKYRAQAWSEKSAAPLVTEVVVKPGGNSVVLDLKGGAAPGPSTDKFGASRGQ